MRTRATWAMIAVVAGVEILSMPAAAYVRIITGMPMTDPTGGYKCFRRRALEAGRLDEIHSNGYSFQIEMTHKLWRQGMRVVEVPIVFTERRAGTSKMNKRIVRRAFFLVLRRRLQRMFGRA